VSFYVRLILTSILQDIEVPVLIVGAGPAGATTALLLGRLGIPSIVISRHAGTANTPRAHIFNQRAMEVLRDAQLEQQLQGLASSAKYMVHCSWLHSLEGEEYGRVYTWGNRPDRKGDYENASPCVMSDLPQSVLEPVLVKAGQFVGAKFRFSTEFISQKPTDKGEMIETIVRKRGSDQSYTIRSRYLIGADGARSSVLDSIGVPVDGKQLNTAFNVHIKADLSRYLEVRPGSMNWILNPDAPQWSAVGNFRMVRPWDEWVVSMHPASKDGQPFEPTKEDILNRLHQMIGDEGETPIEILSSFRWTINDQVARSWQKGNVICIGDAVHRHPPINGLGSNTCISDAFNLSWKLAYVLKGLASRNVLDSVTIERKPVGDNVVRRANEGMEAHRKLWATIGLTAEERKNQTKIMTQADAEGRELRSKLQTALESTDAEFQALGIQMNQIYSDSPCVTTEPDDTDKPDVSSFDFIKEQIVSTFPGFHLPHVWVAKNGQSHRTSVLDLCGHGKFTLLTGIGGERWRDLAKGVEAKRPGLIVDVVSIGWRQEYMDAYGDWEKVRGVEDDGAVLIRPDHFVAWRSRSVQSTTSERLLEVFATILPLP
jgi:2-polyprenyl-6-methoxyphenol hydroxylase-like FAD-dependent oxidoreductase